MEKGVLKEPYPPEISELEETKATVDILNYCQVIYKTVQKMEKKFDDIDEKVRKIYRSRARSFWRYPPSKAVYRKYNYLMSRRHQFLRARRFVRDHAVFHLQSCSPASPVQVRNEGSQNMKNTQAVDYLQTFQYPSSIDNTRAHQHIYGTGGNQTMQSTDDIYKTSQCANFINSTKSIQNTEDSAVFHPEDPVGTSPEREYQETPTDLTSTAQTYQQYYRLKNIPGSYTMPYYSDFENLNPGTITSASKTVKEARTLPPGEYIPVKKPEKKQSAFLKAQRMPVIDPNTCDSSSECDDMALEHFGRPADWSVDDVITVLKHLDPLLGKQLHPIIREQDIVGPDTA
ncbi:hypothetical protein STEG23_015243 [Scotinomys teguina]